MARATDGDFDLISDAFEDAIYGSSKGRVRSTVLWNDLQRSVSQLSQGGMRVLDVGGGAGHFAVRVAQLGNRVVLAEPSSDMRARAQLAAAQAGVAENLTLSAARLQDLPDELEQPFDLVLCHAVLEWLAEPELAPAYLARLVAPSGKLSLLFYNRNASILKRALSGQFELAQQEIEGRVLPRGWGQGCVPLAEHDVQKWLSKVGLMIESKSGIRIFHDHVSEDSRAAGFDTLLALEQACSRLEPFASLAQHVHYICAKG